MADANSISCLKSKTSAKSRVYLSACPDCGIERWNDKRRVGKPCPPCGAKRREKHGLTSHKLYWILKGMQSRCTNPKSEHFKHYGGRGITVCDEWNESPEAFVKWALESGFAPGLEIDRKDVDGPYAPWNCRFVTHQINCQNLSNARCDLERAKKIKALLADGVDCKSAAEQVGVPKMVAWHIKRGNTWRNA